MRTSTFRVSIFSALILSAIFSMAYYGTMTEGYTGAPGEVACAPCHHDPQTGMAGSAQLQGLPTYVVGGQTYPLVVAAITNNEIAEQAGFQMTLLNNANVSQGELTENDTYVGIMQSGNRQYAQHASNPRFFGDVFNNVITFPFSWTPDVVSDLTPVTGYLGVVLGNGDEVGQPGGMRYDSVFMSTYSVTVVPELTADIQVISVIVCNGDNTGALQINTGGGLQPLTYQWSTGGSASTITGLAAGNYSGTITDAAGQQVVVSIQLSDPPVLLLNDIAVIDPTCGNSTDGSIMISPQGGTPPYVYLLDGTMVTNPVMDLAPGTYNVAVVDMNGCEINQEVELYAPDAILIEIIDIVAQTPQNGGQIVIEVSGGTPPYDYFWEGPNDYHGTIQNPFNLEAGSYSLTLTDANGCMDFFTVDVDFSSAVRDIEDPALQLQIAPNPAVRDFTCLFPQIGNQVWEVTILDPAGVSVFHRTVTGKQQEAITLPRDWPAGVYMISAQDMTTGKRYVHRLIRIAE